MYQVLHRIDLNLLFWEVLSLIQIAICDDSDVTLQHLNQAVTTILQSNAVLITLHRYRVSFQNPARFRNHPEPGKALE